MKIKIPTSRNFALILIGLGSMLSVHSALAQITKTELAGNSLSTYPFFEYVKAINANDNVEVAIDPSRFPAIVGQTCDIYVVAKKTTLQWNANITLTDVTPGGRLTVTFSGADIQSNTFEVAAANELNANAGLGLGVGYDVVIDVDRDGLLNNNDFIDGRNNEAGFYRVHDIAGPGPQAVTPLNYSINTTVATTFGIPAGFAAQNLFFPTDVAGVRAATGNNKLPLIIVSHGNGHQYIWYNHIGNHLASYGYVVMSHANNTGPGPFSASTTTLAHTGALIDQIEAGAITGAGALAGNIDTDRIVWIGHSRGAEGVAIAYDRMFDGTYTPTNFSMADIKLISSMLPTDFTGTDTANPHNANYHLWTASGDSDVNGGAICNSSFPYGLCRTYHLHGRATGNRQSTTVQGTGHAWFHNGGGSTYFTGPCSIGQTNTHLIQLGHLLALVKRYVEDNIPSIDFLTRQYESFHPIGVPNGNICIQVSHEYFDASSNTVSNPQKTIVIDDYQTQPGSALSSSGSPISFTVQNLSEGLLNDTNSDFAWVSTDPFNGATQGGSTDGYPTTRSDYERGVVFDWSGTNQFYEWEIPVGERNFTDNLFLSVRGAQGTRHPNTVAALADLTFSITLTDGQTTPRSSTINIGAFGGGFEEPYQRSIGWHNEMETIRVRLTDFLNNASGLDLTNIVAVRLNVGPLHGSNEGRIVIDDLLLSNDRAVYDARDNGDPHITTVDGTNYDFHGAGEYTLLRDGEGYEIQVRQTPVTTAAPLPNGYTGLTSCVAVNTALAARVGNHRISYQPDGPVNEQETRMRLRVDGVIQDINALGTVNLGNNARVTKASAGNGIQVDFPNGSSLIVIPGWWSTHNIAWLNITVLNTPATEGIGGIIDPGQWLPALSDGTHLGPAPSPLSTRHKQLNEIFSKSWRVSNTSSLFDYAAGTSTATFTVEGWPFENASTCEVPQMNKVTPISRDVAVKACSEIIDRNNRNNCVMDVVVTGEIGFAKNYLLAQRLELAGTKTEIYPQSKTIKVGSAAGFVAVIKRALTDQRLSVEEKEKREGVGTVQFYFNGKPMGEQTPVDRFGRAQWTSPQLNAGEYKVSAEFMPMQGDRNNLSSRSLELVYVVR